MSGIRFGTDGVRGRAFTELTTPFARSLGRAAAEVLGATTAVIGRDTRASGPELVGAVSAGLEDRGVAPLDLGVAPTPAVAYLADRRDAIGVMVSASHNPWYDNGIKLFGPDGSKLSDDEQAAIEERLAVDEPLDAPDAGAPPAGSIEAEVGLWASHVVGSSSESLDGLRVVLDCANGAASHVVAPALADLGVMVDPIFNQPDGRNINEACGSTHPEALADRVVETGADLGIALDGDADRLITVDHRGSVVDGDRIMAILARDLDQGGRLADSTVVVTVMTNLGFHRAMERDGIAVAVTPVGDRHVLDALDTNRWSFGGEQSGHLIFRELATTGDGFLSAVQLLGAVRRDGRSLAELADAAMERFPQVLRNVGVTERLPDVAERLGDEIRAAEGTLGADGRVLVRASGTEPVIRVMVEAADAELAETVCGDLCTVVEQRFG